MNWKRRERDLDEEVRAHLEMSTDDGRARGQSAEAARLAALREFGNRDLVKETTRDVWGRNPFHGMGSDIRAGLRTFRKNPAFAAIVVLTLALGIGANTAIFSLVDAVMLRSLPVSHPEQLVQVTIGVGDDEVTNPIWEQLRDRQQARAQRLERGRIAIPEAPARAADVPVRQLVNEACDRPAGGIFRRIGRGWRPSWQNVIGTTANSCGAPC